MTVTASALAKPGTTTIPRRRASIRRTSHIDMVFGSPGSPTTLLLTGRARDMLTGRDLQSDVAGEATVEAEMDSSRALQALRTDPRDPATDRLLGKVVGPGFRASLQEALGGGETSRSPLYLLLDDLPVAALISGYATLYDSGGGSHSEEGPHEPQRSMLKADICSGWRSDGTMMVALRSDRGMLTPVGPPAPDLDRTGDDALGWHAVAELGAGSMRRRRLVDVAQPARPGDPLSVYAMFRDTHCDSAGTETVLHEYSLEATIEPGGFAILECRAEPRSLPWIECPEAAASAGRLAGVRAGALRDFVRSDLKGVGTCTHLNDLLRSLADVPTLAGLL